MRRVLAPADGTKAVYGDLVELLRLALGASITSIALGQLASGMAMLDDLLPTLRSDRIISLPAGERLTYVATELQLWRQADRTSARGSGGNSGGGEASTLTELNTGGGVGYGALYQAPLLYVHNPIQSYMPARELAVQAVVVAMSDECGSSESAAIISNLQSKTHTVASRVSKPRWQRATVLSLALT